MSPEPIAAYITDGPSRDITIRFVEDQHAHDITIKVADLEAGSGVTYTSNVACDHSHTVTLTPEIIRELNVGGTLTVSSNPDATGHAHEWTIRTQEGANGSP